MQICGGRWRCMQCKINFHALLGLKILTIMCLHFFVLFPLRMTVYVLD